MEVELALLSIVGILAVGALSPGPSFVLVAQKSISLSRRDGIACALGLGLGAALLVLFALLGLHAILMAAPVLYMVFKIAGGLYLVYLAYRIWQGSKQGVNNELDKLNKSGFKRSFLTGLFTQLSNPKTTVVFASTFAAFLPQDTAFSQSWVLMPSMFLVDFVWYSIVAFSLSATTPRQIYLHAKKWIDRTTSGIIGVLGLKLIFGARTS